MLSISQAIIVEGKYDKIKLSSIVDSLIIEVGGFGIFKDKEKCELIKSLAEKSGIIVLTDSDSAGAMIRNYINDIVKNGQIYNAFLPEIKGREKRKTKDSAEGFLGVEGVDKNTIIEALNKCGISYTDTEPNKSSITADDLYRLGLSGGENSTLLRNALLRHYKLPTKISKNNIIKILSQYTTVEDLEKTVANIKEDLLNGRES